MKKAKRDQQKERNNGICRETQSKIHWEKKKRKGKMMERIRLTERESDSYKEIRRKRHWETEKGSKSILRLLGKDLASLYLSLSFSLSLSLSPPSLPISWYLLCDSQFLSSGFFSEQLSYFCTCYLELVLLAFDTIKLSISLVVSHFLSFLLMLFKF
jgi:hypothetical protein